MALHVLLHGDLPLSADAGEELVDGDFGDDGGVAGGDQALLQNRGRLVEDPVLSVDLVLALPDPFGLLLEISEPRPRRPPSR